MSPASTALPSSTPSTDEVMVRSVTVIASVVVGLTFIFGLATCSTLPSDSESLSGSPARRARG